MNLGLIKFPVVTFSKGNVIFFARNESELTSCNSRGLRNGFYNGLIVVDSDGNQTKVKEAKKIGTIGGFFGYNIFLEQRLKVELLFSNEPEKIELEKFKQRLLKVFNSDTAFWDSDGELINRNRFVQNASSIMEIIEKLAKGFYQDIN